MLTAELNAALTQVGPGTPMGEMMRRYWFPVAFVADLDEFPVKKVRLLGEDFAVYKMPSGRYGIIQEACPHRRASLAYGIVEEDGIRCSYHGWKFDCEGRCTDQPAEPEKSTFKDRIQAQAGRAAELGGMVWAYIGPEPAPELPRFDVYVMDGLRDVAHCVLPCNYLQIMENSVDPHHVEWLHGRYFEFLANHQGFEVPSTFVGRHVKIAFDAFEWGIIKRRLREGQSEDDDDWKVGHPLVFPHSMRVGGGGIDQMQIRVPIDDTHTWFVLYTVHSFPGIDAPDQATVPHYEFPVQDEQGRYLVEYAEVQDAMAWATQGPITDRTVEHLGKSDIGIVMLRRMYREQMEAVAEGQDPLGTIRERHDRIDLPCEREKFGEGARFALQLIEQGTAQFSPQKDLLMKLHREALRREEEAGHG